MKTRTEIIHEAVKLRIEQTANLHSTDIIFKIGGQLTGLAWVIDAEIDSFCNEIDSIIKVRSNKFSLGVKYNETLQTSATCFVPKYFPF